MRFKRIVLTGYVFKIALGFAYDGIFMLFRISWASRGIFGGRLQGNLVEDLESLLIFYEGERFLASIWAKVERSRLLFLAARIPFQDGLGGYGAKMVL